MGLCKKNLGDKGYPSTLYKTVLYDVAETSSSLNYPVPRFFICSAEQLCPFSLSYFHSSSRRIADCCKGNSPLRLFLRGVPVSCSIATGMSRNNNGQEILVMLQSASRTQRVRCAEAILGLSHFRQPCLSGFIDRHGHPRAHSGEYSIPIDVRIADCIALLQMPSITLIAK